MKQDHEAKSSLDTKLEQQWENNQLCMPISDYFTCIKSDYE
jgi:hypothetical protein